MKKDNHFIKVTVILLVCLFFLPIFFSFAGAQESTPQADPSIPSISVGPGNVDYIANFIFTIYDYLKKGVASILELTIFKAAPELADFYGQVATLLASLTAIFIILQAVDASKKIVKFLLIFGWLLLIGSIVLKKLA
jgi:hypothetical protein